MRDLDAFMAEIEVAGAEFNARMLATEPVDGCRCWTCDEARRARERPVWPDGLSRFMIVCELCGNKRCPHATYHDNACTGSNESNQAGSRYQSPPR